MLKMEFGVFVICFAEMKANTDKKMGHLQKLKEINLCMDATHENSSLADKTRKLKIELDEIAMQKTWRTIIKSRAT